MQSVAMTANAAKTLRYFLSIAVSPFGLMTVIYSLHYAASGLGANADSASR
jgi:hypothetical protein